MSEEKKPQLKRELAVEWSNEPTHFISFYATPDAVEDVKQFGRITLFSDAPNLYHLVVDGRYDFQEVLEYLKNY